MIDVEGEAAFLLDGTRESCSARALVRKHLGPDSLIVLPRMIGSDAALAMVNGERRIAVRANMPIERERWALLHELAEWHLERLRYQEPDVELVAEALTAALVAPREAYLAELRAEGRRFGRVAKRFLTTQTCVALRLGETTGQPVAVVAPTTVRVRGDEWGWPGERAIRGLTKGRLPPELERLRLTDDRARAVLVARAG